MQKTIVIFFFALSIPVHADDFLDAVYPPVEGPRIGYENALNTSEGFLGATILYATSKVGGNAPGGIFAEDKYLIESILKNEDAEFAELEKARAKAVGKLSKAQEKYGKVNRAYKEVLEQLENSELSSKQRAKLEASKQKLSDEVSRQSEKVSNKVKELRELREKMDAKTLAAAKEIKSGKFKVEKEASKSSLKKVGRRALVRSAMKVLGGAMVADAAVSISGRYFKRDVGFSAGISAATRAPKALIEEFHNNNKEAVYINAME